MGRSRNVTTKQAAERRFVHRVDVPVPEDGLGRHLDEMLDWLHRFDWDHHGHSDSGDGPEVPRDFARFYFEDFTQARDFACAFAALGAVVRTKD